MTHRFVATLQPSGSGGGFLAEIPLDVPALFGGRRVPVRGSVNGTPFRTTIAVYGGRYYLGFRKEIRDAAGIAAGDELTIELERDEEPRTVEVPADLAAVLGSEERALLRRAGLHPPPRVRGVDRGREARADAAEPHREGSRAAPQRNPNTGVGVAATAGPAAILGP
jgi:hypothetical protein